ncbi:hypothetical protein KIN20_034148 [Parelaphostrongylus tenuis]|uniref:Dymeclin n=1 Tax=Parelaphostrongylus tenuis TaxID=148309 RepID=A0AAD5R922_PARTN|nr:hypothetical protein KIN20_034148 [Parelaphostrongylus tenuis]
MATHPIDSFMISLLTTISAVLGCGVLPAGQGSERSVALRTLGRSIVTGLTTLPVAMVYSGAPTIRAQVLGIAFSEGGAQAFLALTVIFIPSEDDFFFKIIHKTHDDITALKEGIRTLLEIINSALCANLCNNPHLIYTLLYHHCLFESYQHHPMLQDPLKNIMLVISHFSSKVVHVKAGDGGAMMKVIEKEAVVLPTDRLTKFPELRFR